MKPSQLIAPLYPYSEEELQKAYTEWGCNCGPSALATMLSLKPDDVHPHIQHFDERHYTSPSMMAAALQSLGVKMASRAMPEPKRFAAYGLNRIQWEGPWYGRFAYHRTHWVGSMAWSGGNTFVFDCNGGWKFLPEWEKEIAPLLTAQYKRATGGWHVTHAWQLSFAEVVA
jgi:hypothetical protein